MARNIHPRIVSELIGHSEIRTTLDLYSHVSTALRKEATDQLDAMLAAAGKGKRS